MGQILSLVIEVMCLTSAIIGIVGKDGPFVISLCGMFGWIRAWALEVETR